MSSQAQSVQSLLQAFPQRPFDQKLLHELVGKEVTRFQGKSSPDNLKSQWEFLLKNEVFTLAVRPRSLRLHYFLNKTMVVGNRG
jgi:hypothetical protein